MQFAPRAHQVAVIPIGVGALVGVFYLPAFVGGIVIGVCVLLFYRDPNREPNGFGVLAPADGRVTVIRQESDRLRIGIFMNIWNVHVNRAPVAGEIVDRNHMPGSHRPAFSKESDHNERVKLVIGTRDDDSYAVIQIAGTVARRITSYVELGDVVDRGDRIGHIAFGSRVDVLLPARFDRSDLVVQKGDAVRAGKTVLIEP